MRNIVILLLVPFVIISQNQILEDMCMGTAMLYNEAVEILPKTKISYKDTKDIVAKHDMTLVYDKDPHKGQFTVLVIKIHKNLGFIFGYAPSITSGHYDGYGDVVLIRRENGDIKKEYALHQKLNILPVNNEKVYCLSADNGVFVSIDDYFEVRCMKIPEISGTFCLPEGYMYH